MTINLFKILTIINLLMGLSKSMASPPDTLVVYVYVHITDTIWVDSEITPLEPAVASPKCNYIDEIKSQLELFSDQKCATIPPNDIILSNKQQSNDDMKKLTLLGLTLFTLNSAAIAQTVYINTFGVYLKGNVASQTHWYPGISQYIDYFYEHNSIGYINEESYTEKNFGRYGTNNLLTMGIGLRYEHFLNKRFSLVSNIGYLQRGSSYGKSYVGQESNTGGTVILTQIPAKKNRFHNVSADVLLKWRNNKNHTLNPYLYTGLRFDYTLERRIEYQIDDMNPFPYSSYKNLNNFTYGLVYGAGVSIKQNLFFEVEANNDIGFVVQNDILKVRNLLFSFNLGYNFAGFKRKSH